MMGHYWDNNFAKFLVTAVLKLCPEFILLILMVTGTGNSKTHNLGSLSSIIGYLYSFFIGICFYVVLETIALKLAHNIVLPCDKYFKLLPLSLKSKKTNNYPKCKND